MWFRNSNSSSLTWRSYQVSNIINITSFAQDQSYWYQILFLEKHQFNECCNYSRYLKILWSLITVYIILIGLFYFPVLYWFHCDFLAPHLHFWQIILKQIISDNYYNIIGIFPKYHRYFWQWLLVLLLPFIRVSHVKHSLLYSVEEVSEIISGVIYKCTCITGHILFFVC